MAACKLAMMNYELLNNNLSNLLSWSSIKLSLEKI